MSAFVVAEEGIVINRTAAELGKIPIAAWDIGSFKDSKFLSTQPDPALDLGGGRLSAGQFEGGVPRKLRCKRGEFDGRHLKQAPAACRFMGIVKRHAGWADHRADSLFDCWSSQSKSSCNTCAAA